VQRATRLKRLKRFVRYLAVRAAFAAASVLPLRAIAPLGRALGRVGYLLAARERRWAHESLATAFPELPEAARAALARRCFEHLGQVLLELACLKAIDGVMAEYVEWCEEDRAPFEAALASKQGIVFVTGHVGNWELLARRAGWAGLPVYSIAKETTDPRLTAFLDRARRQGNVQSIWRASTGTAKQMLKVLRQGSILGLLIDQDTRVQSVFVPFFGKEAATPRAAADLALRTRAQLWVGFCQRAPTGRYQMRVKKVEVAPGADLEADVVQVTARLTSEIEQAIRQTPEQWVWMHRRWKTRPGA
jgi:KDO2-lipid IV(A) lauroyltransferase